jgi:hypothetical protein
LDALVPQPPKDPAKNIPPGRCSGIQDQRARRGQEGFAAAAYRDLCQPR